MYYKVINIYGLKSYTYKLNYNNKSRYKLYFILNFNKYNIEQCILVCILSIPYFIM